MAGWILILFYGWLSNHFVNWIPPAHPVLLLLDDTHHILILLLPSLPKQMVFFCIVCLIQLVLFSHGFSPAKK